MKPYLRIYFKLFVGTGVPFGVAMGVLFSFAEFPLGLFLGLAGGAVFGAAMSLLLGSFHILCVKRIADRDPGSVLGVRHVRTTELALPAAEAFDRCVASLGSIKKASIRQSDRPKGLIEARTGATWRTTGELLSFRLRETDGDRLRIEVSSRPRWRTTLADYGKNLENVQKIIAFLQAEDKKP